MPAKRQIHRQTYASASELPRAGADSVMKKLVTGLPRDLKGDILRAYEAQLSSLAYTLTNKDLRRRTQRQVEELSMVIALAAFNRLVMLQMRGFADFGRSLIRKHGVTGIAVGRETFEGRTLDRLHEVAVAFQQCVIECRIPKYMLEYADVPSLLEMYDSRLKKLSRAG